MSSDKKEDKVVRELKVYLRPDADVKLFRIPESLPSKAIAGVSVRPENRVIDLESRPRKSSDNQVYNSRVMLGQNSLAVGMIREDKLFLTQVSDSYEFKPCLQRLDDLQNSRGQSARSGQKGDEDVNVENEASKVTSVTMRFAGANEEDMKRAREHSYVHHLEKIRSEPAIDLEYVPETSLRAKEIFESLGRL